MLRDNVWGPQIEDAARRDFTINAMYYDPLREVVVDYHGGIKDAKKKLLRMIGDPATRYREDPVRIIRAVRFAAKLGFEIEPKTRAPIKEMAALLDNVPPSRTFDEMIKLLQTGHALASIVELRKQGLHRGVFPVLDVALDEAQRHDGREKFVQLALADTDARVAEGKPVAPSFMLAACCGTTCRTAGAAPGGRRAAVPRVAAGDRRRLRCAHRRHLGSRQARRRHARDLDDAAAPRARVPHSALTLARAAALSRRPRLPAPARRGRRGRSGARRLVGGVLRRPTTTSASGMVEAAREPRRPATGAARTRPRRRPAGGDRRRDPRTAATPGGGRAKAKAAPATTRPRRATARRRASVVVRAAAQRAGSRDQRPLTPVRGSAGRGCLRRPGLNLGDRRSHLAPASTRLLRCPARGWGRALRSTVAALDADGADFLNAVAR